MMNVNEAKQSGYKQSFEIVKKQLFEGYHLSYHRVSLFRAQLGYYTLLSSKNHKSEKVRSIVNSLLEEIDKFPKNNDENVDLKSIFDSIKSKFQKFCTVAKINSSYPEADKLEFSTCTSS